MSGPPASRKPASAVPAARASPANVYPSTRTGTTSSIGATDQNGEAGPSSAKGSSHP